MCKLPSEFWDGTSTVQTVSKKSNHVISCLNSPVAIVLVRISACGSLYLQVYYAPPIPSLARLLENFSSFATNKVE